MESSLGIGTFPSSVVIKRKNRWALTIGEEKPLLIAAHIPENIPLQEISIDETLGLTIFGLRNQPPIFDRSGPVELTVYDGLGKAIGRWISHHATLRKVRDLSHDPNDTDVEAELLFHEPAAKVVHDEV